MSDKKKWPIREAIKVADVLLAELVPDCERIAIAGSIRRGKEMVGDIEIVYCPRVTMTQPADDWFAPPEPFDHAEKVIKEMLARQDIVQRSNVNGGFTWGKLNKLAMHRSCIPVDFVCEPNLADWARTMVIRTGPKELNLALIKGADHRGLKLHAYNASFTHAITGEVVPCTSEQELFALCGMKYLNPEDR